MTNNSGQICFASSRVYVQEGIYDKFLEAYLEAFRKKADTIGDPENPASQLGPVVDKAQYERVMGILEKAKNEKQGTLRVGGGRVGNEVSMSTRPKGLKASLTLDRDIILSPRYSPTPTQSHSYTKMRFSGPSRWSTSSSPKRRF